ncbi:MAG: cell division protein CrgA [Actinomycetota bacterium]|nr:cell division protein CrgA [Actinomycetota bacterium]
MPKSKVRKKSDYTPPSSVLGPSSSSRQLAPSAPWYPVAMLIVFVIGLAWISVYYIAGERIPLIRDLNAWNFAVGFGFLVVGLVMAVRWR